MPAPSSSPGNLAILDHQFDCVPVRILTSDFDHRTPRKKAFEIRHYSFGVQFSLNFPLTFFLPLVGKYYLCSCNTKKALLCEDGHKVYFREGKWAGDQRPVKVKCHDPSPEDQQICHEYIYGEEFEIVVCPVGYCKSIRTCETSKGKILAQTVTKLDSQVAICSCFFF